MLRGDLVGEGRADAAGVGAQFVVAGVVARVVLPRRVRPGADVIGVVGVAVDAQVRGRAEVLLVLRLEDRLRVVAAVARVQGKRQIQRARLRRRREVVGHDERLVVLRQERAQGSVILPRVEVVGQAGPGPEQILLDGVVGGAVERREQDVVVVQDLDVVFAAVVVVGDAEVEVDERRPDGEVRREVAEVDRPERVARCAARAHVGLAVRVARRRQRPDHAGRRGIRAVIDDRAELVGVGGAAELIDVAVVLVVAAAGDVIGEQPVGRGPADLEIQVVIVGRAADVDLAGHEARIRSGADHLIDEAGEALALGISRRGAGVDLQFELAERRDRAGRIVVERAVDGDAVEFVADLVGVAAADVDGLQVARLVGRHVGARDARDRGVRAIQSAAAAQRGDSILLRGVDGVDVGRRTRLDERR